MCAEIWFSPNKILYSAQNERWNVSFRFPEQRLLTLKWVTLHFFAGSFWTALKCSDIRLFNASVWWTSPDSSVQSFRKREIWQTLSSVPVTSFSGEPALNLTLLCPKQLQLGKYFTVYPLSYKRFERFSLRWLMTVAHQGKAENSLLYSAPPGSLRSNGNLH